MDPADHLDDLLGRVEVAIGPEQRVLELGCRRGPLTGVIADRAASVIAADLDHLELADAEDRHFERGDLTWVVLDGETLEEVEDASVDVVLARELFRRLPGAKAQLAHLEEIGRVLAPGGFAVVVLSTEPPAPPQEATPTAAAASRREMFRTFGDRLRPSAPPPPAGTYVPLEALGAVAVQAGLELERIEGSGTRRTTVLARRVAT